MEQREIFDMKIRRVVLGICWLLSLTLISLYGGTVSYGIFFGLTLVPFISFLYISFVWIFHRIYQEIGSRNIVCGQSVPYYFVLKNESFFAFAGIKVLFFSDFSYVEELPEEIEYELLPGEQYKYDTSFVCRYRGEYEVGIKSMIISDFFGIFCMKFPVRESKKIIAAPKLIQLDELKSVSDISVMMQREHLHTTDFDVVTREYAVGDALKQVNWKATAREGKLMSRRPIGEEKRGVALIFDTKRFGEKPEVYLPIENKVLEIVLALSLFMSKSNISVSYFYHQNDGQIGLRQGRLDGVGDVEGFYEQIKGVHFDKNADMKADLMRILQDGVLIDRAIVFFVLHEMDDDVLKMTYQLAENDTTVICYVVTDENIEEFCTTSDLNRRIIAITPEAELEEVL